MPRPERLFYRGPHGKPQSVWNTLDAKPLRPALSRPACLLMGKLAHWGRGTVPAIAVRRVSYLKYLLAYHEQPAFRRHRRFLTRCG